MSFGISTPNKNLSKEKVKNDKKGISYSGEESSKSKSNIFVSASKKGNSDNISKIIKCPKDSEETKRSSKCWVCHFCGKPGHIRPFCYKLQGRNTFIKKVRPYKNTNPPSYTYLRKFGKKTREKFNLTAM